MLNLSDFRPMSGTNVEPGYELPKLVSKKIDGLRCVVVNGIPLSRNLKPIRNLHIQNMLRGLPHLDGEITSGDPNDPLAWNKADSAVMSKAGEPDFTFHVFDCLELGCDVPFSQRLAHAEELVARLALPYVVSIPHVLMHSEHDITEFARQAVEERFEGAMLRDPRGPYKFGKATAGEGWLLKIKPWEDSEAVIIGAEPLLRNTNEAKIVETGLQKRGKSKDGMAPEDTIGALLVRDLKTNEEFSIGSGLDAETRKKLWVMWQAGTLFSLIITYKFVGLTVNNKPRLPIFKGIRDPADMEAV